MGHLDRLNQHLVRGLVGTALVGVLFANGSAQERGKDKGGVFVSKTRSGWVNPLEKRYVSGAALSVCDEGSFFVGGVPKVTNYGSSATTAGAPEQLLIGQMYVQFQIPEKRSGWPLIMVHGSGYTGAALDATPDGREGWLPYAVSNNIPTFVVDQPGRGRSGFDRSIFHEARVTGNLGLIPTLGGGTSNNIWTSWFGHLIPAGSTILNGTLIRHGDPGDPDPPEDPALPSPAHGVYPPRYPIPPVPNSIDPRIAAREGALGAAPNPANNAYLALQSYKQLVPNTEVTLPTSTCAACVPTTVAASNTWSPLALADLLEGLGGGIVSPHSQASAQAMHLVRILKERGELHLLKGILIPEGATDLVAAGLTPADFDDIPLLVVNGDYRALAIRQTNWNAVAAINARRAAGLGRAKAEVIDEDAAGFAPGFNGTTHMNMLGTNNLQVFDLMLNWAKKNIRSQPGQTGCKGSDDNDRH
jgi:hypothetical protein